MHLSLNFCPWSTLWRLLFLKAKRVSGRLKNLYISCLNRCFLETTVTQMCHEEKNEGKHYCYNKVLDGKGILLLAFEFSITSYFLTIWRGCFSLLPYMSWNISLITTCKSFPGQALDFLILSICSMLTWTLLMVRNASRSLLVGNHLSFYSTLRYWDYEKKREGNMVSLQNW